MDIAFERPDVTWDFGPVRYFVEVLDPATKEVLVRAESELGETHVQLPPLPAGVYYEMRYGTFR